MTGVICKCEEDGQEFEVSFSDVEEYKQTGRRFLCQECEAKASEAEEVSEPKRRFEYETLHVCKQNPARPDLMDREWKRKLDKLSELGHDGWEAVAVIFDGVILLKREYFE